MADDISADIPARIELLLEADPSESYSRDEIIDLLSDSYPNMELERTLGEMEVLSSMTNPMSRVYSTCGSVTVWVAVAYSIVIAQVGMKPPVKSIQDTSF